MKYPDGQTVHLGDKVRLGSDAEGFVVCSIDANEYTEEYPKAQWDYLQKGVLIHFSLHGLIHYVEPEEDLTLVERASTS